MRRRKSMILLEIGHGLPHLTPEFHWPSAIWWRDIIRQTPSQVKNKLCITWEGAHVFSRGGFDIDVWIFALFFFDRALIQAQFTQVSGFFFQNSIFGNFFIEDDPRFFQDFEKNIFWKKKIPRRPRMLVFANLDADLDYTSSLKLTEHETEPGLNDNSICVNPHCKPLPPGNFFFTWDGKKYAKIDDFLTSKNWKKFTD